MEIVYIMVAILLAIVISDILSKVFKSVPIIFFQIIIGVLISYLPFFREIELDPELLMIILIKPLIFSEAQRLSLDNFKKCYKPILSLSLALVIITIIITGMLINLIFPRIPLTMTFILIAMIIPTKAGIVESISNRLQFPHSIFHILEGESLFNECIAILIFDIALKAFTESEFVIGELVYEFVFALLGGLVVGIILGFIIIKIRQWLAKNNFENPSMMVVIQIITPFVVYMIAEKYLHVSGILAVIVTGMIHGLEKPMLNLKSTKLQLISDNTWDLIDYLLNGIIAIYLGLSLPSIIANIGEGIDFTIWELILISVLVYMVVIALRFLWVLIQPRKFKVGGEHKINSVKGAIIYALSGVHGTITLLIALSIPVLITDTEMFILRQELIFIAALAILISIVIPTMVFPVIFTKKDKKASTDAFKDVRREMIYHTIFELERVNDKKDYNLMSVVNTLRSQLVFLDEPNTKRIDKDEIENILSKTTEIELKAVDELIKENKISKNSGLLYKKYTTYSNKMNMASLIVKFRMWLIKKKIKKSMEIYKDKDLEFGTKFIEEFKTAKGHSCKAALSYLNDNISRENYEAQSFVIEYYKKRVANGMSELDLDDSKQSVKKYFSKAFRIEHTFVQDCLEKGLISDSLGDELKESISYDEMIYYKAL